MSILDLSYTNSTWVLDFLRSPLQELKEKLRKASGYRLACYETVGNWIVFAVEDGKKDYNYYSKAWHRNYGPKWVVNSRTVYFRSLTSTQVRKVELKGWRGNWQLNALIEAKIIKPKTGKKHIRLHPAYDIKLISNKRGYQFYQRSLKGDLIDYCLVSPLGLTYHGTDYRDCLRGLKRKRVAKERQKVATINLKFVQGLGFCSAGIHDFCRITDLDYRSAYTPQEIYEAVTAHWSEVEHFRSELQTLAKVVGFEVPKSI